MTGGNQVKTITIRLPEVEAAMLVEIQKRIGTTKIFRLGCSSKYDKILQDGKRLRVKPTM